MDAFVAFGTAYMPARPPLTLRQRLRLTYRLSALGLHIGAGFVLAVGSGALFWQYRRHQVPLIQWWLRRLTGILGLNIRVHGTPIDGPKLWISNHVSWVDIPVLGGQFPLYFLSKAEVAHWPLLGRLAKAAGTLFIKRGSGDAGKVAGQFNEHLQAGRNVLFFPEGTTTDGYAVKRFFAKLFTAAVETQCAIQPVVICYRHEDGLHPYVPFIGDDEFFSHALDLLAEEPIDVDVMVLPAEAAGARDARTLAKHFEHVMGQAVKDIHGVYCPVREASLRRTTVQT